jgi:hypothetical protein
MPVGRRPSWSASQRRSSLSKAQGGASTTNNAAFVGVDNIVSVSKFTKQMNPCTQAARDVDVVGLGREDCDLSIGDVVEDDDDEDLKLENILSCIVNDKTDNQGVPVLKGSIGIADLNSIVSVTSKQNAVAEALRTETPPILKTNPCVDDATIEEEDNKLLSIIDVAGHNRMIARKNQKPDNSSSGAETKIRLESKVEQDQVCNDGTSLARSSLVDSILDDIQMSNISRGSICFSDQDPNNLAPLLNSMTNEVTKKTNTPTTVPPNRANRGKLNYHSQL